MKRLILSSGVFTPQGTISTNTNGQTPSDGGLFAIAETIAPKPKVWRRTRTRRSTASVDGKKLLLPNSPLSPCRHCFYSVVARFLARHFALPIGNILANVFRNAKAKSGLGSQETVPDPQMRRIAFEGLTGIRKRRNFAVVLGCKEVLA